MKMVLPPLIKKGQGPQVKVLRFIIEMHQYPNGAIYPGKMIPIRSEWKKAKKPVQVVTEKIKEAVVEDLL